jgi:hypothetical protein
MTLVHEATHARIAKAGITYKQALRARIERLCVEEEAAFADKLPQGQQLAADARRRLEEKWWETPAMFDRRVRQLRISGWPGWTLAIYRFLFAPGSRPRSEDSSTAA